MLSYCSKFNHIDAAVYADYTRILRKDVLSSRRDLSLMDRTVAITRRVGLSQIPLTCVFLRYIWLIFENTTVRKYLLSMSTGDASNQWAIYSIATGTILSLLLLKVFPAIENIGSTLVLSGLLDVISTVTISPALANAVLSLLVYIVTGDNLGAVTS